MSGGYFDYIQHRMQDVADQLEEIIDNYGAMSEGYEDLSEDTLLEFKCGLMQLQIAIVFISRIDYLLSGDDGEDSFHERLVEDLKAVVRTPKTKGEHQ